MIVKNGRSFYCRRSAQPSRRRLDQNAYPRRQAPSSPDRRHLDLPVEGERHEPGINAGTRQALGLSLPRRLGSLVPAIAAVAARVPEYACAWDANNVAIASSRGPLWVALGDSLSQGVGASSYRHGWVGQVDTAVRQHGRRYRILNLSRTGATTPEVGEHQVEAKRAFGETPALITLLVGANDMLRRNPRAAPMANYDAILRDLRPGAVVANLPRPVPLARKVNRLIATYADNSGVHPVNVRPAARSFRGHRAGSVPSERPGVLATRRGLPTGDPGRRLPVPCRRMRGTSRPDEVGGAAEIGLR